MPLTRHEVVKGLLSARTVVLSYLYAISGDIHVSEDAFQEIVIRASDHHEEIRDAEHLLAWARTVGRNLLIDALRRSKRQALIFDSEVLDGLEVEWRSVDLGDHAEKLEALRTCMDALSLQSRQLIEMRYQQGLSGQQIAERLGRPRGSVYVSLTRVYRTLADCVRSRVSGVTGD